GVARAGEATVFPQAIALAATFNQELVEAVSNVTSTEARAKYNLSTAKGRNLQYMGLTYWTPNINIFRDPRWGRGQETYGEDPYLTSQIGTSFVKGLQGTDALHLKIASAAKHFVAHSGPESTRDYFDAIVDEKDLRETYMYAFHKLVDGGVESIMTAYNRVNGMPNSVNKHLIKDVLRKEWGFKGHVVTDCGALDDVFLTHKTIPNATETAAAAIKAGIDLDCSTVLQRDVVKAIQEKLLTEKEVDVALGRLLKTQFKLGFFDDKTKSPFYNYRADSIHNMQHIELARKAATQSMVLLKNNNSLLPLKEADYPAIMVVGPNAASLDVMLGSYHGVSSKVVNFVEGITGAVDPATRVEYDMGCDYQDTTHFGGIWAAGNADLTIAVLGLSPVLEGEAGDVVITAGSNVDVSAIADYADAIIFAWYPGEQGGNALADIVFGKVNPSGRLPVTFYNSVNDLPSYESYSMNNRTYRYFKGQVQYPFGFGLSYTTFNYEGTAMPKGLYSAKDTITVTATIKNTGIVDGDEVVQAYIKYPSIDRMPLKELKSFKRISVPKGKSEIITLKVPVTELLKWDLIKHTWKLYPGTYQLVLGSSSADEKLSASFQVN
ncbi:MAG: glycosyl hydrolase, partial [Pedobacter sp.]